jgi:predicted CXXCH cytochrome family protein
MLSRRALWFGMACLAVLGASVAVLLYEPKLRDPPVHVGTATCAGCHRRAFDDWQQSHHRHAMEVAAAGSVLGDFTDASFDHFGTTSRFFTRDGQYFVETDNARGELESFRITHTFGWYPLQQYLVEIPDGRLQALGISWDSRPAAEGGQRWFHLYPDGPVRHDDLLHWTGAFQNWNSRCAFCHVTDLRKGYSQAQNRYATQWAEAGVGCEGCHGPGSRHVSWAQGKGKADNKGLNATLAATWRPGDAIRPTPTPAPQMSTQLQVCSACHSRRSELQHPDPATAFDQNFSLTALLDGLYHADGQILEEVYETGSFLQSRMHQNHVSCTNCHEPHSSRLRASGNALCLQCHEPRFDAPAHHFHQAASSGAQCVNCHMPTHTYMGVDVRRDHSFRIPDPAASVASGVPNACTQCHEDRDDRWAAAFIAQRTGSAGARYEHTAPLSAARRHDPAALPALLAYAEADHNPVMLRAIALQESARFPSPEQVRAASHALSARDPQLRMAAVQALGVLATSERLALLAPLLADPIKAVRMAVARQLIDVPPAAAPAAQRAALTTLLTEYRQSLLHSADMPEAMSDLGILLAAQGDLAGAENALLHARRLSPRYLPALLNLADVHRARGREDLGEVLLNEAMQYYPASGDVRHMLGLLYVRTDRTSAAVELLKRASELAPDNPQYALVHAVSLIETGRQAQGIAVLETALRRFPGNAPLQQALAGYRSTSP